MRRRRRHKRWPPPPPPRRRRRGTAQASDAKLAVLLPPACPSATNPHAAQQRSCTASSGPRQRRWASPRTARNADTPPAAPTSTPSAEQQQCARRRGDRIRGSGRDGASLHTYGSSPQLRCTGDMAYPHPFCVLFTGCGRAMATSLPGRRRTGWVMNGGCGCAAGGNRAAAPLLRLLKARVSYAISTHIVLSRSICTVSPVPKRARSQCISRSERGSSVLLSDLLLPKPSPPSPSSSRERRWRLP